MSHLPVIDESACSAHGDCEHIAPHVFRVEDIAVVIGTGTGEELLEAAQACPAAAISVIDSASGERIYP